MIKDYRFKDIENYLKKDAQVGEDILDAFSKLADAAIIFGPIAFGPQLLPLLGLLDVKDRLVGLGKTVVNFIASKQEQDYIKRAEQIKAAYALICYTAYFDALQRELPTNVRKKLKLKCEEKQELIEGVLGNLENPQASSPDITCNVYFTDHATSLFYIKESLISIYERISDELVLLIADSSIFNIEKSKEKQQFDKISSSLMALPSKAIEIYEAQYLKLADQFNDFAYFAQLQNFNGIQNAVNRNGVALKMLSDTANRIDIGLTNLNGIVNAIETNYSLIQAQDIVDELRKKYNDILQESIIDDKEIKSDSENNALSFPKIIDAFIPQSYKCLSYQRRETRLEDELRWKKLPIHHDMDRFFIKYLFSPDSIDYPLVILGHPGSGKSLLTKVLAAQLMSDSYTVIRIPLREVDAAADIDVLVEDQVKKLTSRSLSTQGYGGFAAQFIEKPLIIILDGFDELLQAKGDVFIGYIEKTRLFQQNQKLFNRPVRMIITSRITLIDKARIPENSTILRLMEFDAKQRQAWIDIWNRTNNNYFLESNVAPFKLPPMEGKKKGSLLELAEQPLLLLMLAIYDSDSNELAHIGNIKRTELYDNLLRRFVRRERSRYVPDFVYKDDKEQEEIINKEMNRLGVVAIGMYNRQDVVILSDQLENDLDFFKARRSDGSPESRTLRESDSVLGGFFFIHKSTAQDIDAHSDTSVSAFEFLHNTFGEFLAADIILRYTVTEVKEMFINRKFNMTTAINNKLSDPDSFDSGWFACLMFVPLYSRPVIIEMLKEHALKALQRCDVEITQNDFFDNLKFIVKNQLKMVLSTRNSPSVMRNGILSDRDIPLVGYLSTYTLNLIILASVLCPDGFEFDEDDYYNAEINESDSKPWDKIALLWRTWFSPKDLIGLSVVIKAYREKASKVVIKCNDKFEAIQYEQPIDSLLCISSTLADNFLTGLTGLQTQRFAEITKMKRQEIKEMLKNESPDLYFSYLSIELRREINGFADKHIELNELYVNHNKINDLIKVMIKDDDIKLVNQNTLLCLFDMLECCFHRKLIFFATRKELIVSLARLLDDLKINPKKKLAPEVLGGLRLLKLLIGNPIFPFYNRKMSHNEFSLRNKLFELGFGEEIYRLVIDLCEFDMENPFLFFESGKYQTSLIDVIENSPKVSHKKKLHILSQIIEPKNIRLLAETNPELLSRVILMLIQDHKFGNVVDYDDVLESFFKCCIDQLSFIGFTCFGFDAIINAIKIGKFVRNDIFLSEITKVLKRQLFGRHPEIFLDNMHTNPSFVVKIIDLMPEIISNYCFKIIDTYMFDHREISIKPENAIDIIRIFRVLFVSNNLKENHNHIEARRLFQHIASNIYDYGSFFSKLCIEELTLVQLRDLMWYSEIVDDHILNDRIRTAISHFPDSINKRTIFK